MSSYEPAFEYLYRHLKPWAKTLLVRCLNLQDGEYLGIVAPLEAAPLAHAVHALAIEMGAHVDILFQSNEAKELFLAQAHPEQLTRTSELWQHLAKTVDAYLYISTYSNTRALSEVPTENHTLYAKGYKPIIDSITGRSFEEKMRWCLTQYPTPALAQEADMSTLAYYKMAIEAAFLDKPDPIEAWKGQEVWQNRLIEVLSKGKTVRFVNNEGTDLEVDISQMQWVGCSATCNFPDGEVFTGPNLKGFGAKGRVHVTFPTIYKNVEVRGIKLEFLNGKVISIESDTNIDFLKAMIHQDEGASYMGEIAIGTNGAIQRGTKNILFDEKIGGSFHFALGSGYPETGNTNKSQLHWDLVTDLRKSGKIFLDGICIFDRGQYLI
ncbi:MAG: aminopeptidase [Chlamydia sp.]